MIALPACIYAGVPSTNSKWKKDSTAIEPISDSPVIIPVYTKDTLPTLAAGQAGATAHISDGDSSDDCLIGGGTTLVFCRWDGSAWESAGDGTGGVGSGSMTTVKEGNVQVGDADIIELDFGVGFTVQEAPDTEVNVDHDVTPSAGSATLIVEQDAIQVKYDSTDFTEGANGLYLGASPTITTSLAIGADPADAGALRLSNAEYIYSEADAAGTDISVIGVDLNEVIQIGASGSSGAVITPATTITGALTLSSTFTDGVLTGDGTGGITGLTNLNSVTATELAELETIGATTISAAQWTGLGGATTAGIALWDDADNVAQLVTLGLTATASEINTPLDGASVTLAEFQQLEAIGATTVSAAQWAGLGGATTAGLALWDDADNVAQLVTLGLSATASEINTPLDGASVTLTEFQELETIGATTISAAQWAGLGGATTAGIALWDDATAADQLVTLGIGPVAATINVIDDGLTTEILVGGGAGVAPVWGTDLPTAVTIGSAYIYRVDGTDIADADVVDTITASNYLPLAGGILTGEVTVDNLGLEFTEGDDHSDCSAFAATGGGIFYDDSDGKFKKCQDNVLTDMDTDTGGAPALSAVTAPTAAWGIAFDDTETITWTTSQNTADSFFKINNTVADVTNQVYLLDLDYSVDDNQANADYIIAQDAGGTVFTLSQNGDILTTGSVSVGTTINPDSDGGASIGTVNTLEWQNLFMNTGAVINFENSDVTITHSANTLTLAGGALDLTSGGITNVGTIGDDGAITLISSGGTVTVESVVFTGGVVTGSTSLTDGTATLTGGALTGLTTPLTVAQGGTGATSNTPTNITPVDTGNEAAAFYPIIVDGTTGDQATETDAAFTYNPNTDTLTVVNLDVLGAPLPADPGADRFLKWDDSETGAELVWASGGAGDVLSDGSVPFTGNVTITNADPELILLDSDSADGTATLSFQATGANEIVASLQTDVAGTPTTYIELDGITATIDLLQNTTLSGYLAIGADPADAGTGIRMSNNTVIEFEDTEGTGEVTALQVDAAEAIFIGDANASGVTIVPATTISGALTLSSTLTDGVAQLSSGALSGVTTLAVTDAISLSNGATIDQSGENLVEITENTDSIQFVFAGTDLDIVWDDGVLNLRNNEDAVNAIVEIEGKDAGERGELRVLSDGDDKEIALYHDDTDAWIAADGTTPGDIIIAPDGDETDYLVVSTAADITSISVPGSTGTLGTAAAEWDALYLNDGGIIYGENSGLNTLTSSATGWTVALDLDVVGTLTIGALDVSGVADPVWTWNDSDAAGADDADEEAAKIFANMTTTTEDAEVSDLWFTNMQAGTRTTVMLFDGSANSVEVENIINAEAGITVSNGTTTAGFVDYYEDEDDGASRVRLIAPALAASYTLTLPTSAGADTNILAVNDSGETYWTSAGAATAWHNIVTPAGDQTLNHTTYETVWNYTGDADFFTINYNAAMGSDDAVLELHNTVDSTAGSLLELQTLEADDDVNHIRISQGATGNTEWTKIVDAGTVSRTLISDGFGRWEFTTTEDGVGQTDTIGIFEIIVDSTPVGLDAGQYVFNIVDTTTDLFTVDAEGDVLMTGALSGATTITASTAHIGPLLDAAGDEDMDYGSADVDDHTFITDGTGDAEFVVPNDSIGNAELDWGSMTDLTTDGALGADVVDEAHIADNGIDSEHYNDGSIDIEHMSTDSVDYDNTTGSVKSLTPVADTAANFSANFTGANLYGGTFVCNGAGTLQLPAVAVGMNFTIVTLGALAVSADTNTNDLMILDGTALHDGDKATNLSTAGDIIVFQYYDATGWLATSNGWTDGGA
jgi:hypothetical protein